MTKERKRKRIEIVYSGKKKKPPMQDSLVLYGTWRVNFRICSSNQGGVPVLYMENHR